LRREGVLSLIKANFPYNFAFLKQLARPGGTQWFRAVA
jgi:hypothetical protein